MSLSEINIREKDFHNKLQSQTKGRFENIFYKAISNCGEDFLIYLKDNAKNSKILDFGCGIGSSAEKVIKYNPKKIIGIDMPQINREILISNTNKNNNSSKDINFIDALNGLIVLILICMIALGLSERFRKF